MFVWPRTDPPFDPQLRSQFPGRVPSGQPEGAPPTPKKRNTVLASLTRTLSPRRGDKTSFSSTSSSTADLLTLSTTLTAASADDAVRAHVAWLKFFATRRDDLESARVERRIKRARSDQTMHLALDPVPVSIPVSVSTSASASAAHEREERQEPSAASGATEELVVSGVEHDEGEPGILTILGGGVDTKYDAPLVVEPEVEPEPEAAAGPEDDVKLEAASARREGSSASGLAAAPVEVEVALEAEVALEKDSEPAAAASQEEDGHLGAATASSAANAAQDDTPALREPAAPETSAPDRPDVAVVAPHGTAPQEVKPAGSSVRRPVITLPVPVPRPGTIPPSLFLEPSSFMYQSPVPGAPMSRSSSTMSAATTITKRSRAITLDSFDVLRVLGKGCAGKVLLVKKKGTEELFALKAITKRHVRPLFLFASLLPLLKHDQLPDSCLCSIPRRSSLTESSHTRAPSRRSSKSAPRTRRSPSSSSSTTPGTTRKVRPRLLFVPFSSRLATDAHASTCAQPCTSRSTSTPAATSRLSSRGGAASAETARASTSARSSTASRAFTVPASSTGASSLFLHEPPREPRTDSSFTTLLSAATSSPRTS